MIKRLTSKRLFVLLCIGLLIIQTKDRLGAITIPTNTVHSAQLETILQEKSHYPSALVNLALNKEETIPFVANYPNYKSGHTPSPTQLDSDYTSGKYPLFIQWDERWGYDTYGDNYLAINGCGPTTLAMVIAGLTGDTTITPLSVANFSARNGHYVNQVGTSWSLMSEGALAYGLKTQVLPLSENTILATLQNGDPIIASMGPGTFTSIGHFILLTGVTEDGKITIHDSDSRIRSQQTWDIDVFMNETKNLWKFSI